MATFAQAFKPQVIGTTIPIKQVVNGAIVPVVSELDDLAPKVAKNSDDVIDALRATIALEDEVKDAKILAQAGIDTGNRAIKNADDALGKAGRALGEAADLADRIFNILNFLATLGTAARMEYIRNELLNLIRINSADIDVIQNQIQGMISSIAANAKDIDDLQAYVERELMGLAETLSQIRTQNNAILQNTSSLLSGQNSISSQINNVSSQINNVSSQINQLDDIILGGIPNAVCTALNSDCWDRNFSADCPELDLSSLTSSLDDIHRKLGNFPYNCAIPRPYNGVYDDIAEALQALTCSSGLLNSSDSEESNTLEESLEDIKKAIDELETNAVIPEHWQVRVGADRPQLVISYAETLPGGKIGRSRYPLTIPHWNGKKTWNLLPRWRKGNIQARMILKDNSRIYLYAHSEEEAKRAMTATLKFVDSKMIDPLNKKPFIGKANIEIKDIKVEPCTAKFYEKGQLTEIPTQFQIRNG